ncbi:AbrB family transcriptional regulator [Guptibacillus hwajinpoensis]|uniref:AbrB family transcriptional regulator n=1 Tax=Guptibacillus hwajinpoensis TaxID=208199 RepID=UPI001CFDD559|nr:AbrB family transcriptional regulator [Pseudalkalibacillus hwajinpoensis]WLR60995.1 AbrB family transcriptional regulator [Pseudalkalibacillus hwajinpoensis]
MKKAILLVVAFTVGYLFDLINIPAGWLLGAMLVGAFYRLVIDDISYPNLLFDLALAIIGISISLSIKVEMFTEVTSYILPLFVSITILLIASWILGKVLAKYSNLGVGIGMAMLGVIIGTRFDRSSLVEIKNIGWTSAGILLAFFFLTFVVTFVFYLMTPLDFITSLLAIVPAGAPQMSSVAASLQLDASIVAAMQVIRLLVLVLIIPMLVPFLVSRGNRGDGSHDSSSTK